MTMLYKEFTPSELRKSGGGASIKEGASNRDFTVISKIQESRLGHGQLIKEEGSYKICQGGGVSSKNYLSLTL